MNPKASTAFPKKLYLSGADCFFLAMEKHYQKFGTTGNTCHLFIQLNGKISKEALQKAVENNPYFTWLSSLDLKIPFFRLPYWEYSPSKKSEIIIEEMSSEDMVLPYAILNKGIFLSSPTLFRFTLIHRNNGKMAIVFSWHHILMDAKGAETLIRVLGKDLPEENVQFFPPAEKKINIFKALYILHFSKEFVKKSSRKPLVQLVDKIPVDSPQTHFKVLEFSLDETLAMDKNAIEKGVKISKGSFYLASATKSINQWLLSKGNAKGVFWVPVPQNRRRKGIHGPILSNLQSFLFYRIPREKLASTKEATSYLTNQMFDLIKGKRPDEYAIMSDVLRYIPSSFYYFLIKGPGGGSIASFLYSDPGINAFKNFLSLEVETITNFPPGTYPPGLMIIFERFNERQKVVITYSTPIVQPKDVDIIATNLISELLT